MRINFSSCKPVNNLWADLVKNLGIEKAHQAVRQAFDLQGMHGNTKTLPLLFVHTGGIALTSIDILCLQTGIKLTENDKLLLYSSKENSYQILHEIKN